MIFFALAELIGLGVYGVFQYEHYQIRCDGHGCSASW